VAWGAYAVFDFKEKSCLLHELILRFDVPGLTPTTADVAGNGSVPRLTPGYFFFQRIEIVMNNNIIDTLYGGEQFLKNQLFISDEKRKALNYASGVYNDKFDRYLKATRGFTYYVPLHTFFNISHMPLLYPKDDIQIRIYMNNYSDCLTTLGSASDYGVQQLQANLRFDVPGLTPSTTDAPDGSHPRLTPGYFFFQRIEIVMKVQATQSWNRFRRHHSKNDPIQLPH